MKIQIINGEPRKRVKHEDCVRCGYNRKRDGKSAGCHVYHEFVDDRHLYYAYEVIKNK